MRIPDRYRAPLEKALMATGKWLGTLEGVIVQIVCAIGFGFAAAVNVNVSTFGLSEQAIIEAIILIFLQAQKSILDSQREKAMQRKDDEIIRAIPEADNSLIGSEPEAPDE